MTAPLALPWSAVRARRVGRRLRRGLLLLASAALLVPSAAGCVTVYGAEALVPSVKPADAQAALDRFARLNNDANRQLDPAFNGQIETGALGAIDEAGIQARHVNNPAGNPGYQPLIFSDAGFLIPQQVGWPKWFVANTASNKDTNRWLLVFTRDSANQVWRVSYLASVPAARIPQFATDSAGHVEPVPPAGSDLAVQPGQLSQRYATYLQQGTSGSAVFANGPETSGLREERRTQYAPTPQVVTQFADQAADQAQYPPVALRLAGGGALVFFTTLHQMKQTVAHGPVRVTDPNVNALMQGTPNTSVTLIRVAEQVVTVPASGTGGQVVFLDRIEGLVGVRGQ